MMCGVVTRVGVGSLVVAGAGEVVGVAWYELGFERLRDEGLDGMDELKGLSEARVPSIGLSMTIGWGDVLVLLLVN